MMVLSALLTYLAGEMSPFFLSCAVRDVVGEGGQCVVGGRVGHGVVRQAGR